MKVSDILYFHIEDTVAICSIHCIGMTFLFFSTAGNASVVAIVLGRLLTGEAVCGMHYVGQGGISNYHPLYARA